MIYVCSLLSITTWQICASDYLGFRNNGDFTFLRSFLKKIENLVGNKIYRLGCHTLHIMGKLIKLHLWEVVPVFPHGLVGRKICFSFEIHGSKKRACCFMAPDIRLCRIKLENSRLYF